MEGWGCLRIENILNAVGNDIVLDTTFNSNRVAGLYFDGTNFTKPPEVLEP